MKRQRSPRLSLDLLRGFRAAARNLSFTLAARELYVTQSAISHEVKALELQLGTPLFTRVNRTLRLTQAGEQLYRAVDEALALIDSTAEQVAGAGRTLSITTTVPLASLWLGPRLPAFTRLHPDINLRVAASNDNLDLARERIDIAIRHASGGKVPPSSVKLFDYEVFPVCSPKLARSRSHPLRSAADLTRHVLLELETVRDGRPWYDWQLWLQAKQVRGLKPAGVQRFSHYDRWPHLARQLHEQVLVAPLGDAGIARMGAFHLVVSELADRRSADAFVSWLTVEAQREVERREQAASGRRRRNPASARSSEMQR
jgi:DNA-binding transcriptional LysR family regulator